MTDWRARAACRGRTDLWTIAKGRRAQTAEAVEACSHCPVLTSCREHAARFPWHGIVIAGWAAPSHGAPARPPWA